MSDDATVQEHERVTFVSLEEIERTVDALNSVDRVVRSHRYVLGSEVERFEQSFAEFCGVDRCVAVGNGTDALEIALRCLGVAPGEHVLTVANAGHYGSTAIRAIGAIPEYVEIDEETMTMSATALSSAMAGRAASERPAAIIVTHLYGQLAEIESLVAVASDASIPVIEDCAQAHGATRGEIRAGAFGSIGCFSFYPTKNLGAIGDGGALVTGDATLAQRARSLRQYGWDAKYHVGLRGGRNSRLDEIQAAVLNDRLPHLDEWNSMRRAIARIYRERLHGLPLQLAPATDEDNVMHLFVARVSDRDRFRAHLSTEGIDTDIHYPVPDHRQQAYAEDPQGPSLPRSEAACARVVSLPCYPGLSSRDQERVIQATIGFFSVTGY